MLGPISGVMARCGLSALVVILASLAPQLAAGAQSRPGSRRGHHMEKRVSLAHGQFLLQRQSAGSGRTH